LQAVAPNVLQAASDGLTSIPGYQSIAADLGTIAEHNNRARRYRELAASLNQASDELISHYTFPFPADVADLDPQEVEPADAAESTTRGDQRTRAEARTRQEQAAIYVGSRISKVRDRVIDGILKQAGNRTLLSESERRVAEQMVKEFNRLNKVPILWRLHQFDVYYPMRRVFFITQPLTQIFNQNKTPTHDASIPTY